MIFKDLSPCWNRFALCLLFAFLMSLAFPPLQLGFLAYWALLPLFFLFEDLSLKQSLLWGYVAGFFWNTGTLYWIGWVTIPGLIGVLLVMPLYLAVYAWIHVLLRERFPHSYLIFLPGLWVTIEFLKSLGSLGFPWTTIAYTQSYYTDLIQYASITGVYGVSFWVVLVNIIVFTLVRQKRPLKRTVLYLLALLSLFGLPYLYSKLTVPDSEDLKEHMKAAVIQGNIDPYLKWSDAFVEKNFLIYDSLSYRIRDRNPDLVVWPETATACYLRARPEYLRKMRRLTDSLNTAILTGSPDFRYLEKGGYETYNGLLLFQPRHFPVQSYWKMHLVPFGERVPFEDSIPFLHNFFESLNMGTGDFAPGRSYKLFSLKIHHRWLQLAGVICFESVFPDLVRRLIKMGGRLLVVVTNDAWFGNTSGPYQHARIAVFRAIENRVGIVRCANTGISSFIDPYGRVVKRSRFNEQITMVESVPLRKETTFYTLHGDVFTYFLVGVTAISIGFSLFRWS